ncbi:hypothetical protein [Actinomadura sp. 6K520]|uniref:hypothetical protein n=1 Tax=Actinomadura sp. 6K520 TaxID=2530364 RepID=UPI0010433013|nr:hypothetical protein [Actinomadura sp. 6K520]TDE26442.1 hypothetical protein E1289_25555 [Actinomadura sp. 6K520]
MNGHNGMDTSALIRRLEGDLETDFPCWLISREHSGRWVAVRPAWGALYGQSAVELRERLGRFTSRGDVR